MEDPNILLGIVVGCAVGLLFVAVFAFAVTR